MDVGHFYYIKDQYFIDFPDKHLMTNKENVSGISHDRPCFYAFQDKKTGLYWMIPISSQVKKYERIYNNKIKKYGNCDTIDFGYVLGHKKAFLIQNMCPVDDTYIKNEYLDLASNPVRISKLTEKRIIKKAKKALALHRNGKHAIFPDIINIETRLLS